MIKRCYKCSQDKDILLFSKDKSRSDGYSGKCSICKKEFDQKRYSQNKERLNKNNKIYRKDNKDLLKEKRSSYRKENKEIINKRERDVYAEKCKDPLYKEQINKAHNNWYTKSSEDVIFRLRRNISRVINKQIKKCGSLKNKKSSLNYLPFSLEELECYIENLFEPWMTWENHGNYKVELWDDNDPSTWKWQLDHIIPHSLFYYENMECKEFKKCWSLSNLRPYSAKQNVLDGNRRLELYKKSERETETEKQENNTGN